GGAPAPARHPLQGLGPAGPRRGLRVQPRPPGRLVGPAVSAGGAALLRADRPRARGGHPGAAGGTAAEASPGLRAPALNPPRSAPTDPPPPGPARRPRRPPPAAPRRTPPPRRRRGPASAGPPPPRPAAPG